MGKRLLAIAFAVLCLAGAFLYSAYSGWKTEFGNVDSVYRNGITVEGETYASVASIVEKRAASALNIVVLAERYLGLGFPEYDDIKAGAALLRSDKATLAEKAAAYDSLCMTCTRLLSDNLANISFLAAPDAEHQRSSDYLYGFIEGEKEFTYAAPIRQYNAYAEKIAKKAQDEFTYKALTMIVKLDLPQTFPSAQVQ
ncbi:MAG: hypothetical protein PHI27_12865 [Eubacteriales bacterium]|nr:hypothetical protein [Eubacteriales bacterium]MDD3883113.1 hypothetical protein [Eubacteriales bacterium]MDD4513317.1 hypothetical protein [Eubacteriales bacterium]